MNKGVVSYTRLYESDDKQIELITNKVERSKAQVIRMLVHEGIKQNIIPEFEVMTIEFAGEKHVVSTDWIP